MTPKSPRMISTAKRAPATGALKVAAIPAAAPQPTSVRRRRSPTRSHWPIDEPMAEPIWTIGPSRPTDPPDAMHTPEATSLAMTTRGRIRPPRSATASMTSGTPCPLASEAKRTMIRPTIRPPTAGVSIFHHDRAGL